MKKWFLPLAIAAAFVALYEQSKPKPNVYIMVACIVVVMIAAMRLSAKLPSKHKSDASDETSKRG